MKPCAALAITVPAVLLSAQADETRLPVIARMQVVYSVVAHHNHVPDRIAFYQTQGQGNLNYAVPHLVYEPIVTLYNPYNTPLVLPQARIRMANPPVGFRFKKNNDYLRAEWEAGGPFFGLGRFQIANENNANAQKTLTLSLGGGTSANYSGPVILAPGEWKTFGIRVEANWTWGLETASAYSPRSFFDWDTTRDFTNKDGRTNNLFGAEAIPVIDLRAGFQTDSLSVGNGRPVATRYSFETGSPFGNTAWVAIHLGNDFKVEAKGVDTVLDPAIPDFQLSILGGAVQNPVNDTLKSYSFSIADLVQPETPDAATPSISRTLRISDILQTAANTTPGGKTWLANFVIAARSSALQQRKFQEETVTSSELYEVRLDPVQQITDGVVWEGPSDTPLDGVVVTGVERVGDNLMLDVAAPSHSGNGAWKIEGSASLDFSSADDLTPGSGILEGPPDTGVYKVAVPVPPGSEAYFVRIVH